MNRKKTGQKVSRQAGSETATSSLTPEENKERGKIKFSREKVIIPLVLVILVSLGYLFKDKFVAATVNGKPILRYELNQRLASSFGKETLENLIVERLIADEAKRKKVLVSGKEIDEEVSRLSKSLGEGTKIEDVLKFQGISMNAFRQQLKIRLQVNKILESQITVSEEEITQFIKDNSAGLTATGEAERREEAKGKLKEQKVGEKIQGLINELLTKAKISRFLK